MLPTKFYQALEAVLYVAVNAKGRAVSAQEIACEQALNPRHLEPLLQKLVHSGFLKGVTGPKGGYILAKEKRKVTLADLLAIFTEQDKQNKMHKESDLYKLGILPTKDVIETQINQQLSQMTLESLLTSICDQPVSHSNGVDPNEFTI